MLDAALGMVTNAILLVTVGMAHAVLPVQRGARTPGRKLATGAVLGLIGLALMFTRWELFPGVFFDTRSVLLAVSGLFFGAVPTAVAVVMMGAFRILQGGAGMWTGLTVIVTSATLGLLWRHLLPARREWLDYYLLGVVVHLAMLAAMLLLPEGMAAETLRRIALPVMVIHPLATMVLGKLLEVQRLSWTARDQRLWNERRLRGMLEKSWEVICLLDEEGRATYVSESVRQILGHAPEDLLGKGFMDIIHPEDRSEAASCFRALVATPGGTDALALRLRRADGDWLWFENILTDLVEDPDIGAVVVNSRDITERSRRERAARGWQRLLKYVIQHDPSAIAVLDRKLNYVFVSDRFLRDHRIEQANIIGRNHYEVFPEIPPKWREVHRRALAGEVLESPDDFIIRADGRVEFTRWQARPWHDASGEIGGIVLYTEITTERKKTEQAFQAVLESSLEGFWVGDLDGRILQANDAVCRNLGYAREEFVGMGVHEIHAHESQQEILELIQKVVRSGGARFATEYRRRDGSLMDVEVSATYLGIEEGRLFVFVRDLTEHVAARQALQDQARKLEQVLASIPDALLYTDLQRRIVRVNPAFERILGYSAEEAVGRTTRFFYADPEDYDTQGRNRYNPQAPTTGEPYEVRYRRRNGEVFPGETAGTPIQDADGKLVGFLALIRDVSERHRDMKVLRAHQRNLAEAQRIARLGSHEYDPRMESFSWSDEMFRIMGRDRDGFGGRLEDVLACIHPEDRDVVRGHLAEWIRDGVPRRCQHRIQRPGGEVRVVREQLDVLQEGTGGLRHLGTVQDITEEVEMQRALRESEAFQRSLVDSAPVGILRVSPDGRVQSWNRTMERIFGWSEEEVMGRPFPAVPVEKGEEFRGLLRRVLDGETLRGVELDRLRKDGSMVPVSISAAPIHGPDGGVVGVMSVIMDMTDRRHLEEQLRQSQKLEAVGQLAGGVAHDFNNLLAVIMSTTEMALLEVPKESTLAEDLEMITQAARRSAGLTRQLLAFSRKQIIRPTVVDLNQRVMDLQKTLGRLIGEDIEVHPVLEPELWRVYIDPSQVDQILANLAVNARDAIQGVGTLSIETRNVTLDPEHGRDDMPVEKGEYAMLSVADTGRGMAPEVLAHIFEPFFTTKGPTEGTGLGLATVYGIVKQNNGVIHAYSEAGLGATFKIYLPRHRGAAEPGGKAPGDTTESGTETILVVEDDDGIRRLAERYLKRQGYHVLAAGSPHAALAMVEAHPCEIDLLLSDVVMPGMNGKELDTDLRRHRPHLRTLFMSGYTADIIARRGILPEGTDFIQKPFTMSALARRVREVLDRDRAAPRKTAR